MHCNCAYVLNMKIKIKMTLICIKCKCYFLWNCKRKRGMVFFYESYANLCAFQKPNNCICVLFFFHSLFRFVLSFCRIILYHYIYYYYYYFILEFIKYSYIFLVILTTQNSATYALKIATVCYMKNIWF